MGLSTQDFGSESDVDQGSGFKDYFVSTLPRSRTELPAAVRDSACNTVREQCNARSLHAVLSSRNTTLNLDRGSGSSESRFSIRVESP